MADIKFSCPHCHRDIQCDELWGGHQIQCPVCQGEMVVPQVQPSAGQPPAAPSLGKTLVPTPPAGSSKLSAGRTQVARSSSGTGAVQKGFQPAGKKKTNRLLKFALIGLVLVIVAGGAYFAANYFGLFGKSDEAANAKPAVVEKKTGRTARGPIGEATGAMDASDALDGGGGGAVAGTAPADAAAPKSAQAAPAVLPVIAPIYTLTTDRMKIPQSKVNGTISSNNFVADTARIDRSGSAYVLTFRQGAGATPDAAVLVFLHLKPNEGPTNQSYTVSPEARDPVVTQVQKLWKRDPKYAASQKAFSSGFGLKLELGGLTNGTVPGKIYLALPDTEESVVAGVFKAAFNTPDPNNPFAAGQGANPNAAAAPRNQFNQRYGIRNGGNR